MKTCQVVPFYFDANEVRTITDQQGNPLFVAKDVASVLGYSNTNDAINRHCKGVVKHYPLLTPGGMQSVRFIHEPDLYRMITGSQLPAAVEFERWVFEEVLPTIRKTGTYTVPQNDKRVFVNHAHSKTTNAPGGLDIRYTMDLTKVVINPTRRSVEFLERLTGIQLTDIPLNDDIDGDLVEAQVKEFCRKRCRFVSGERVTFAKVYEAYRQENSEVGILPVMTASRKRFSSLMSASGFSTAKLGGTITFLDLALVGGNQ